MAGEPRATARAPTVAVAGTTDLASAARARLASEVAAELEGQFDGAHLDGLARDHAGRSLTAALDTLELLEGEGWPALTGATTARGGWGQLGADAVAPTGDPGDPVEQAIAG